MENKRLNKRDFIKIVQEVGSYEHKKEAERAVNAFKNSIEKILSEGKEVDFVGFGKFFTTIQKGKVGKVPKSGKEYKTENKVVPKFRAGKNLKALVEKIKV